MKSSSTKISRELSRAADILNKDGVVGIPTETVYGLAASIFSKEGISKIFKVKERPSFDPLIVHISNLHQKEDIVREWPALAEILAKNFWPGPLTMVLKKNTKLNSMITSGLDTVGIRMPKHSVALELIDQVGPLAAPSANKFGKTSPTSAEHVKSEFKEEVFVLNGGTCEVGLESTVIAIEDTKILILRPGMISEKMLRDATPHARISYAESSASPGHLKHHYQPKIPLYIFEGEVSAETISSQIQNQNWKELELDTSPAIAARQLYESMRKLSNKKLDALIVLKKPNHSSADWLPIWDRLTRASSKTY
ncbi:MAG: threonylcarbamoyl-AMP synthase [Deltaproteobacteria bacterium]|nr:threonylcarbamoyl-AMP synthase [Deltaproteobacteria bacterium]